MESISRLERGLPPMVRGESKVTVGGFDFVVSWHHYCNPGSWVEEDIIIEDDLRLDADRCQDLLDARLYEELMDAVDRKVNKGPLD
jgi:hypothetical protein